MGRLQKLLIIRIKGRGKFYRDELFLFPLSVFIVKESMSLDMSRLLPIIRLCIQDNLV